MSSRSPASPTARAATRIRVTPVTPARRLALAAALVLPALLAAPARGDAQILQTRRTADPRLWLSVGPSMYQSQSINDGQSNTVWQFGTGIQYRGALELGIGGGTAVGVTATWARMPMTYYSTSVACDNGCDGDVTMRGLALGFHAGGSEQGLHQVIEATAGVNEFTAFDIDGGDAAIADRSDLDFAFTIGYGIGFQLNPRLQIGLVQDVGVIWHQKEGLPADASNIAQQRVTRLTVRFGAGQRGVRR